MSVVVAIPQVVVEVGGQALNGLTIQSLIGVRVRQRLSQPTQCEMTFDATAGDINGVARATPGDAIAVRLPGSGNATLFDGQITAVEYVYGPAGEQQLFLRGYDRLIRLRYRQSVREFRNIDGRRLARELAGQVDLPLLGTEDGPEWPMLIQHAGDDLEFLTGIASQAGLYFHVRGGGLHIFSLKGDGRSPVELNLGAELLEARFEVDDSQTTRHVDVVGWNPLTAEMRRSSAGQPRSGRRLQGRQAAPALDGIELSDEATPETFHAQALAQAELDYRHATAVTFWGIAEGNPALRPGSAVIVGGVNQAVAGQYILCEATHSIDARLGYVTEIETTPPPRRRRARSAAATFGVVSAVSGRNGGRVKVKLPTYNSIETDWLNVLAPAAGDGKGFVALPDRGDTVLVLLPRENPAQGVVLGGLFGNQRGADSGVSGNDVRRYTWATPDGQRIRLDDDGNTIRIENGAGSFIELAGGNIRIVGSAIDFQSR